MDLPLPPARPASLPRPALWLGLAGLLPFLAAALAVQVGPPAWRGTAGFALLAYGALILSFLGGVHWGFGLAEDRAVGPRLGLGVVPARLGLVALLLPPAAGLLLLGLALPGTALAETLAARRGLVPPGYLRLRWGLSLGASLCLLSALGT